MKRRAHAALPDKRDTILMAALALFSQYGYRRTSVDEIARQAEIAKRTVYLSFSSNEEIFQALGKTLIERVESAVEKASASPAPFAERLAATLEAKFGFHFETVHRSPHAAELIDSKNRLCGGLFGRADRRYPRLLRDMIEQASREGEIAPAKLRLDSSPAAELVVSARGIELNAAAPAAYYRRLRELVRVILAGFGARAGPPSRVLRRDMPTKIGSLVFSAPCVKAMSLANGEGSGFLPSVFYPSGGD